MNEFESYWDCDYYSGAECNQSETCEYCPNNINFTELKTQRDMADEKHKERTLFRCIRSVKPSGRDEEYTTR
ncbi:MAG: hypothetical protein FWD71_12375 [Oscillospiraceae bacterium]|nr:hypothetical protein [Oscillospiraceae bacterium]